MNQLASIIGANDIPLTFIVFPGDKTYESELEGKSFLACNILQAPVESETFKAESRNVHQLIVEATAGTEAEDFLLSVQSFECGWRSMKILTKIFKGTGNNNRCKGVA